VICFLPEGILAEAILETNDLTRHYGDLVAVDNLNLAVDSGEVFGLLGPNGAGKTTAIKMFTTLLKPTSGSARVAGFDIVKEAMQVRRIIGYVPQLISADATLTGYENLLAFASLYDIPHGEIKERVRQALAFMGLEEAAGRMVRTYSGGMIRRLEIAQSVLHRPRLLFLDEPTIGLDPLARKAVWKHIMDLRSEHQMTVFMTTHMMDEADSLCQRIAIMHHGKVAAIGQTSALKQSVGEDATLEDVFIHYTGDAIESGESYRQTASTRRTARRLG
jgi:ABC-2 type transport system ATP-binding protein